MREIKFRAFHEPTKQMFDVFSFDVNNVRAWYPEKYGLEISPDREDCILMQYTGLKDKNGREIYEGDIVKCNYDKYIFSKSGDELEIFLSPFAF